MVYNHSMDSIKAFYNYLQRFTDLTEDEFNRNLLPICKVRRFGKKEIITKAGEIENYFNFRLFYWNNWTHYCRFYQLRWCRKNVRFFTANGTPGPFDRYLFHGDQRPLADTTGENDTKGKIPEFCNKEPGAYATGSTKIFSIVSEY